MMAAPVGPFYPTSELVAIAWLGLNVPGLAAGQVGTTLPKDVAAWQDQGFLQVQSIPGGRQPDVDLPLRLPVLQLDGWATSGPSSSKPPWNLANRLLELVRLACEDAQTGKYGKTLVVKADYRNARVQAVYPLTEPARVPEDPSGYARFTMDLAVDWVPA